MGQLFFEARIVDYGEDGIAVPQYGVSGVKVSKGSPAEHDEMLTRITTKVLDELQVETDVNEGELKEDVTDKNFAALVLSQMADKLEQGEVSLDYVRVRNTPTGRTVTFFLPNADRDSGTTD